MVKRVAIVLRYLLIWAESWACHYDLLQQLGVWRQVSAKIYYFYLDAQSFGHLCPAITKSTADQREHLVASAQGVAQCCFPGSVAITCVNHGITGGAGQALQVGV